MHLFSKIFIKFIKSISADFIKTELISFKKTTNFKIINIVIFKIKMYRNFSNILDKWFKLSYFLKMFIYSTLKRSRSVSLYKKHYILTKQ
jgi:hypothetical protein